SQHGEIEIEVRRGGRFGGLLRRFPFDARKDQCEQKQRRETHRAGGEPPQCGCGDPGGRRGSGERLEIVGRRAKRGFHHRASPPPAHCPCCFTAHPSCCSRAARNASSSWQCPTQAAAFRVQEPRSSERRDEPRSCESH